MEVGMYTMFGYLCALEKIPPFRVKRCSTGDGVTVASFVITGKGAAPSPAAAKLGRRCRTVIHCGESGRGAARPLPCSTGGDRLFTVLTEPVVSVGAQPVTWGKRRLGPYVLDRVR
uniref:Uncharacterized protein n=1 Tax=Chromera velia CCMP2878 TaxID=1169474 RepID=A0A0G4G3Y4_9ALVE|eukprot:Cvel_20175.t1-p1 / transcript=Cvel_20175.t1 / gene=Cvel_20175 / organism=Chromera_velia_CCMP2878 / gene_product=hypothetical protein / transcript_product=hypothetical protein / location=Cvel_scaffold1793:15323-19331(-) / protein_length=115 / sequence_SO=supercontig / SO=protein_coding / is_pseudo=false